MTDSEWAALRYRMVALAASRYGPEYAEDIVQEALWRFFTADRSHVSDLAGYLMRATMNQGASDWRLAVRRRRAAEDWGREVASQTAPSLAGAVGGRARLAAVTEMIGSAGVDIMVTYSEDGSEMTARRLGISRGQVRVLVCSVRAILRGDGARVHGYRLKQFRRLAERAAV